MIYSNFFSHLFCSGGCKTKWHLFCFGTKANKNKQHLVLFGTKAALGEMHSDRPRFHLQQPAKKRYESVADSKKEWSV